MARRVLLSAAVAVAIAAVLLGAAVFMITQTDWGREQVRRYALDALRERAHGEIRVGRATGNLLTGITLDSVVIVDTAGRPFFSAEQVSTRYSLRGLLSERIMLSDVRLVRPVIVLDRPPREKWNFVRIFPTDTLERDPDRRGLGSWVLLEDVEVVGGHLQIRSEWDPPGETPAERQRAARDALAGRERIRVEQVPGGYQTLMDFHRLDARFPTLLLADPDSADLVVEVERMSTVAELFQPPVGHIRDLAGLFRIGDDALRAAGVRIDLPETRITGGGWYAFETAEYRLALSGDPVAFEDLRWIYPPLPDEGRGSLAVDYWRRADETVVTGRGIDLRVGRSAVAGDVGFTLGDTLQLRDTDLRFTSFDTRLIEQVVPAVQLPRHGTVDGRLALNGEPHALRVDGDLAFHDPRTGTSRVRAAGELGTGRVTHLRGLDLAFDPLRLELVRAFAPGLPLTGALGGRATLNGTYPGALDVAGDLTIREPGAGTSRILADGGIVTGDELRFREMRLRFDPLQVALVESLTEDALPIGGTVRGRATLNGAPARGISATADLVHLDRGERSHVVGRGTFGFGRQTVLDVDARLQPLSLATAGRFAPAAGLQGSAAGRVRARGATGDLRVDADLVFAEGGALSAAARLNLAGAQPVYDVTAGFRDFDAGAVSTRAPSTSLTGPVVAQGRGTDPATLRASVVADLTGPELEGVRVDTVRLRAAAADGLARVDRAVVRLASADLEASGTFGLAPGRHGELGYRLLIESLADFDRYAPADTGFVPPRPAVQAAALERARADSLRIYRATEVERAATGRPRPPPLQVDTVPPIPRDTLAGRLFAVGRLSGNIERFDLTGDAELADFAAAGQAARAGRIRYAWSAAGTPDALLAVDAAFDSVLAAGFALDSVAANIRYRGAFEERDPGGTIDLRVFQDPDRDYRARAEVVLALDRSELRLDDLALRFDTTHWRSTDESVVAWGERGVEVESLELTSGAGGRIFIDGRLPVEGSGDLEIVADRVEIGDIVALLQEDEDAAGLLTLDARVRGTLGAPIFAGEAALVGGRLEGRQLPDVRAGFDYADARFELDAQLSRQGLLLATAEGALPLNLALTGNAGARLLDGPITLDVRADSLPLDALPSFTDQIEDVRGRLIGTVAVRGTVDEPAVTGELDVDLGSFHLVPTGVTYEEITGRIVMDGGRLVMDSLVAVSRGPIRVTGELDLRRLTEPGFDLRLEADDALLLDTDDARILADTRLSVEGPFDGVVVSGEIDVQSGVIYIPEQRRKRMVSLDDPAVTEIVNDVGIHEEEVLPTGNPLLDNLRVDVAVNVSHDTWVRSTDANVEIYTPAETGALRVEMDRRRNTLALFGTLNTDRGEYTAMGRRFLLTRGSATFQGDTVINPLLHLIAEHEVRLPAREAIQIRIHVGGTLLDPTLSLESTAQPPISQTDLLSYLAFGRTSGSVLQQQGSTLAGPAAGSGTLVGGVAEIATRQLASLAIGTLVDEFEAEAARSLGADVFRVTPADVPVGVSFQRVEGLLMGTEVEAGKYFARRWFVAGQARPTLVRPGARVEYQTPTGFRWVLSYEPRFLPREPTFAFEENEPHRTSVLGAFLRWEWRF